jgi:CHAT domain-containing protein
MNQPHSSNGHLKLRKSLKAVDVLTVRDIFEHEIRYTRLAFFSAFSTAESRAARLADGVIHLAGFDQVVATGWPTLDEACLQLVGKFYETIIVQGRVQSDVAVAETVRSGALAHDEIGIHSASIV